MFIVKLVCAVALLGGLGWGIVTFEQHSQKQFAYRFFTLRSLTCSMVAFALILVGYWLYQETQAKGGDDFNGLAMMTVGTIAAVGLSIWNVHRTTPVVGGVGSLLHAGIFTAVGQLGAAAMIGIVVVWAFMLATSSIKRDEEAHAAKDDY